MTFGQQQLTKWVLGLGRAEVGEAKVLASFFRLSFLLRSAEPGREAGLSDSVLGRGGWGIAAAVSPHLAYNVDLPCWLETAYLLS